MPKHMVPKHTRANPIDTAANRSIQEHAKACRKDTLAYVPMHTTAHQSRAEQADHRRAEYYVQQHTTAHQSRAEQSRPPQSRRLCTTACQSRPEQTKTYDIMQQHTATFTTQQYRDTIGYIITSHRMAPYCITSHPIPSNHADSHYAARHAAKLTTPHCIIAWSTVL